MTENSLAIFTRGAQMLAEANTIQKAKDLKDLALTAADWAKRKGMGEKAIQHCRAYAVRAEIRIGEMLLATDRNPGSRTKGGGGFSGGTIVEPPEDVPTLIELGLTRKESSEAQTLAGLPAGIQEEIIENTKTLAMVVREIKREELKAKLAEVEQKAKTLKPFEGVADVVVIDPPWPMTKIEREVRPNQAAELDYPTMSIEEIAALRIPAADDCHVWLWTTHKFLPEAFALLPSWGLKYVCCFVWHKPGGFQPIGLPQYNCEFVLYARKGSPKFIETTNFPVCFDAPRQEHSVKPEELYTTIRRTTGGRRVDYFGRRKIEGFESWGFEAIGQ